MTFLNSCSESGDPPQGPTWTSDPFLLFTPWPGEASAGRWWGRQGKPRAALRRGSHSLPWPHTLTPAGLKPRQLWGWERPGSAPAAVCAMVRCRTDARVANRAPKGPSPWQTLEVGFTVISTCQGNTPNLTALELMTKLASMTVAK